MYFSGPAEGHSLALVSFHVVRRMITPQNNTGRWQFARRLGRGRFMKEKNVFSVDLLSAEDLNLNILRIDQLKWVMAWSSVNMSSRRFELSVIETPAKIAHDPVALKF